jgi:hypothetical protein
VASSNERSRAGSAYPPAASTEKDYVTIVSLRYSVDKLTGFSLVGKPDDDSPFNRLPVESPVISFVIQPLPGQMMDECSMHVREAFRDLAKLVNLKMFVDFPNDPSAANTIHRNPQPEVTTSTTIQLTATVIMELSRSRIAAQRCE